MEITLNMFLKELMQHNKNFLYKIFYDTRRYPEQARELTLFNSILFNSVYFTQTMK